MEVCIIRTLRFEAIEGKIHILDCNDPDADTVLMLPDDKYVKQLKDMWLHWWDLVEVRQSLESINPQNTDIINRSLAQNAIITFYKCFGKNESRSNSLDRKKILAGYPLEAKNVFEYYRSLRNKFIAHDESRLSQVLVGAILVSGKELPFVDTVGLVTVAEAFKGEENQEGLKSFYRLTLVALQWVEEKIDELSDLLKKQYKDKKMSDFQGFEPLCLTVPTQEDMYKKR